MNTDMAPYPALLYTLGLALQPAVELGVRAGESTISLLAAIRDRGSGSLLSVDIADCRVECLRNLKRRGFRLSFLRKRWRFLLQDSVQSARAVQDGSLGLVFVDTCHEYEQTVQELMVWWPKLGPGGVLCGHDYQGFAGVTAAVDEFPARHKMTCREKSGFYLMFKGVDEMECVNRGCGGNPVEIGETARPLNAMFRCPACGLEFEAERDERNVEPDSMDEEKASGTSDAVEIQRP